MLGVQHIRGRTSFCRHRRELVNALTQLLKEKECEQMVQLCE